MTDHEADFVRLVTAVESLAHSAEVIIDRLPGQAEHEQLDLLAALLVEARQLLMRQAVGSAAKVERHASVIDWMGRSASALSIQTDA